MTTATLFDPTDDKDLAARFAEFDAANPEVWRLYVRFANDLLNAGHRRGSSEQIIQRIRWEASVVTRGEAFKINDHYRAFYARKLAASDARFAEFFEFRRSAADQRGAA